MRIALYDDEPAFSELVESVLKAAGHGCQSFATGRALLVALRRETFDLLLLDWQVPGLSGIEVIAWVMDNIRQPPPMLLVTSRNDSADIVAGLRAGADDYIVKPIDPPVLVARVAALLRRAAPRTEAREEHFGLYRFDTAAEALTIDGAPVELTAKEFGLALMLFRNLHRALSRAYILEAVWGRNPDLPTRTLDAHISRIRSKLALRPGNGFRLVPIYSYGYRLERLAE